MLASADPGKEAVSEPTPSPAPTEGSAPPRGLWAAVRDSLSGAEHDYTKGTLSRAILLLAVPMVLEMAMESVFAVVDVFFVGKLGPEAVATVGFTESVLTLVYALAIGLSAAVTATVARRIGEGDRRRAGRAAGQGLLLGLFAAVLIGVPGSIFAPQILGLMGASEATVAEGSGYARLLFGANVVILLLFLQNAVFRGAGDAVVAMRSLWLANGINIVLDPCFIFGLGPFPELGVTGAAVATTIGRGCGVAYQMRCLAKGRGRLALEAGDLRLDTAVAGRLLRVSAGGIGQYLVATSSWVVLMKFMAAFGSQAVAGYTIAVRIVVFILLPSFGLANAATTLVGQSLGAKDPDRAARAAWVTAGYNGAFLGSLMVLFIVFAKELVGLFSDDLQVLAHGARALVVLSYGFPCYAVGMVLSHAFNGAGDTGTPTRINLVSFWLVQIPFAWAASGALGPDGVTWSVVVGEAVLTLLALVLFRRGRWRTHEV